MSFKTFNSTLKNSTSNDGKKDMSTGDHENEGCGQVPNSDQVNASIKEYGQLPIPQDDQENPIHCITIIGQIEGHTSLPPQNKTTKYEHLIPQVMGILSNPKIKGILIILNTVGGDVEAGLAIAELFASIDKPVVSLVLGGAHSIGVPIAVSSDYSFITPSSTMTLHPVRMNGMVIGVSQMFQFFDQIQDRIVEFVTDNSGITEARLKELMLDTGKLARDVGTILVGEEAVKEKIINEVGGLSQAMNKLRALIQEREGTKQ